MSLHSVPITLDRERKLLFTIRTFCDLEKLIGAGVPALMQRLHGTGLEIDLITKVLWKGLQTEDPRLTLERTQDLMQAALWNGATLQDLVAPLAEAIVASGLFRGPAEVATTDPPEAPAEATAAS